MVSRRFLLASAVLLGLVALLPRTAHAEERLPVVATFSILGDMVQRIGGDRVAVTTLVGRNGDAHVYKPTPADARAVNRARLLVVNGLQFEGWLDRLIDASDFAGVRVVATDGIEPIDFDDDDEHDEHKHGDAGHKDDGGHAHHRAEPGVQEHDHAHAAADDHGHHHGAFDPHAWQSLDNARIYVDNIAAALAKADPDHAASYDANRAAYRAEIDALDAELGALLRNLPESRRTIVTSHDAFQYLGRAYGLTFLAPQGLSTESEASARDIARLIEVIRERDIRAVFLENISDPRMLKRIADETGAAIGGTLYPGALSEPDGPASTYLDLMRHNVRTLAAALSS